MCGSMLALSRYITVGAWATHIHYPQLIDNMNVYVVCAALVAVVLAEAPSGSGPYPPSGWRPSGRLLVLPARQEVSPVYGPPPVEYGPPPTTTEAVTEAATQQTEEVPVQETTEATEVESEQLRDSGVYYVLLQDGKLQMVRYRTAPLRTQSKPQRLQQASSNKFAESFKKPDNQKSKFQQQKQAQFSQIQAHQAQFQPQTAKFQQASRSNQQGNRQAAQLKKQPTQLSRQTNQQPQPFHYVEIQKSHEIEVAQPPPEVAPNGFVANLQYRNVEPIASPVFAFNSAPLSRVLKK